MAPRATVVSPEPASVTRGPSAVVSGPPSAVPSGDVVSSTALRAASIAARLGGDPRFSTPDRPEHKSAYQSRWRAVV
jgi:hypothetical protein